LDGQIEAGSAEAERIDRSIELVEQPGGSLEVPVGSDAFEPHLLAEQPHHNLCVATG
jgi:hypothetical protein